MTPEEMEAFRARVLGPAAQLAPTPDYGRLQQQALGPVAGLIPSSPAANQAPGGITERVEDFGRRNILPQDGVTASAVGAPTGLGGISQAAQGALAAQDAGAVSSPGGTFSRPMETPLAAVEPGPTLDPRYGQIGRPSPSQGSGAGSNPLRQDLADANRRMMGTFDAEKDLTGTLGVEKAGRIEAFSSLVEMNAKRMDRDAQLMQEADQIAADRQNAFLARNVELSDQIAKQKTDPGRLMRNADLGTQMLVGLGAALGGALAAVNGGPNQALDRLDKIIDRDIHAQELELDNKKASLSERKGLFGQMVAETGDRRVAAMAARNLMYEAMKAKLGADADRLGIPEVRTNADLAIAEIDRRQVALQTQGAKEAYASFQQQAAAAAHARVAAEKLAWDRAMDIKKMELEQRKVDVDQAKAGKESAKEDNAAVSDAAKQLADDKVIKGKAVIEGLGQAIDEKTGDIKGLGRADKFRRVVAGPGAVTPLGMIANKVIGPDDNDLETQRKYEQLGLIYQKDVTGSGGSDAQMEKIGKAFNGAGTMAEKRAVIQMAVDDLKRREGLAQAGLTDKQKGILTQRLSREGQSPLPSSVKLK